MQTGRKTTPEEASAPRRRGRPRKLPADELREQVLAAASRVFAEDGYDDASSHRIAEISGIPRPTIHRMFGSKQGVFVAAVDRALARIIEHQTQSLSRNFQQLQGRAITAANVQAFLELVAAEPHIIRMLQLADSTGGPDGASSAARRRIERTVANYIRSTWEGKRPMSEREAGLAARLTVAIVENGAAHSIEHPDYPVEEIAEFMTSFIRTGFTFLREAPPES